MSQERRDLATNITKKLVLKMLWFVYAHYLRESCFLLTVQNTSSDLYSVIAVLKVRVSAILTNAPYILNLDCDHYVNNSKAVREAMCFMMDPQVGRDVCYVQFPQRFDGIDRSDRYANRNIVFFDVSFKASILFLFSPVRMLQPL